MIKRWLAAHPRFVLHNTASSSSWLNHVEAGFAELTTRKLQGFAHHSVADLNADIRAWIKAWDNDPKPYVWTERPSMTSSPESPATIAEELLTQCSLTLRTPVRRTQARTWL